ncbi:MAG: hypothetical protein [Circular genetic element sp.]|nr:MAG: hypothetical protein [Circular genetic element sp.]
MTSTHGGALWPFGPDQATQPTSPHRRSTTSFLASPQSFARRTDCFITFSARKRRVPFPLAGRSSPAWKLSRASSTRSPCWV